MEEALESINDFLDEFMLDIMALSLKASIWMSSEMALDSRELNIAEVEEKMFEFAIFLLDATIQGSSIKERSVFCKNFLERYL